VSRPAWVRWSAWILLCAPLALPAATLQAAPSKRLVISQIEETRDLRTLDPLWSMDVPIPGLMVCDSLVRRTPEGGFRPLLAQSIQRVSSRVWRIQLRGGVRFSDGSPLTAGDVKATLDYIRDPQSRSGMRRMVSYVDEVRVLNPRTVDVVTSVPHALQAHFLVPVPILSRQQLDRGGEHRRKPVCTGPYVLDGWDPGSSVRLRRNPLYWGRDAYWDEVVVRAVPEPATRLADLLSGGAQLVGDLLPEMVPRVRGAGYRVLVEPGVRTAYLTFLFKPPFHDARVRRAVYHALDRAALSRAVFGEFAAPAVSVVPRGFGGYAEVFPLSDYDPPRARALLREAGVPLPLRVSLDTAASWVTLAQVAQAQLREAGIETEITVLDRALVFDPQRLRDADGGRIILFLALDNHMFDAMRPFEAFLAAQSFLKAMGYQPDAETDRLIQAYVGEEDVRRRLDLSRAIQLRAKSQAPVVWLLYPDLIYALSGAVRWPGSRAGRIEIRDVWPR
jgi:peptide/nickel transport system substrate-binding protein